MLVFGFTAGMTAQIPVGTTSDRDGITTLYDNCDLLHKFPLKIGTTEEVEFQILLRKERPAGLAPVRFGVIRKPGPPVYRPGVSTPYDISLQIDVGGLCQGKPAQWTFKVTLPAVKPGEAGVDDTDLEDSVDCTLDIGKATLLSVVVGGQPVFQQEAPNIDLNGELKAIQLKRTAAAARQKRLAEDRKKVAEQNRLAQAAEAAKRAEEREAGDRKLRQACWTIFRNTVDKKINDLTVRETEQIKACQSLGYYPPH